MENNKTLTVQVRGGESRCRHHQDLTRKGENVFLVRFAAGVSALAALWALSGCGNIAPPGSHPVGNESLNSGESLAFSRSGLLQRLPNIYLLDDENGLRTVGEPGKNDVTPLWSPDGSQLIYQQAYGWESDYFLLDLASWHTRQLTVDGFYKYLPRWSPDGVRLAYLSANEPGDPSHKSDFLNVVEISNGESRNFPFERVLDYRWRPGGQLSLPSPGQAIQPHCRKSPCQA